ncbi:condensation domain-containing protein [Microbacterium sp. NPDC089189]|uniref:condensation domain-containing protein n=1 Tax=Microbacterium sp. NPDC089189 TaxID=3154972 RepID=UPI003438EE33
MRLTNVSQLSLPPGALHSYAVRLRATDREVRVSFDQGRHVGEGDRPGSWMAMSFRLPGASRARLGPAWDAVIARHGTLRTVFAPGADGVALFDAEPEPGVWQQHPVATTTAAALRQVLDETCRPYAPGSYRLCLVEAEEGAPVVVIGSDHAHVDMWSLLVLARDLRAALGDDPAPEPQTPAAPFAEHTAALEGRDAAPADVLDEWHRLLDAGEGAMPRFPLPLGDLSPVPAEVVEVRDVLDAAGVEALSAAADAAGVRVTALALAAVTAATRRVAAAPLRAVFPVHSRHEPRWSDAVGWFITNAVIECEEADPVACAADIRRALRLGSHPLAPIFAPLGGWPSVPGMFAISWLDTRRLPVAVPADAEAHWVSAAIRTDGVMIWFVINDTGLHLRCRYPDTPASRASLAVWLDAVDGDLRQAARPASGAPAALAPARRG